MPELPEVEVVKNSLNEVFKTKPCLEKITCYRKDLRFPFPVKEFANWKQQKILQVERRAKYLRIISANSSLVCHLGMTGSFRLLEKSETKQAHDHLSFDFQDGTSLVYNDPRRFGFFIVWPGSWDQVSSAGLGVEPLEKDFSAEYLFQKLKDRGTVIKTALMDQKLVVGIGNIYASEILFHSGVRPTRKCQRVSPEECQKIVQNSKKVLRDAIKKGGSSIRDFESPDQKAGSYQDSHLVYGREGIACPNCKTKIKQKVIGGRSSFWCSSCQD